jgi:DNA-binding transcriptional MerR regulator
MEARYPIRAVARITGISLDTLRAWERRHKAVVPERSDRGRQYLPEHIERLVLLNQLVHKGYAIGGIAPLPDSDLKNLLEKQRFEAVPEPEPSLIGPILAAVESFDGAGATNELNRLAAALASRDFIYEVVVPLMREVGNRWYNGAFAIAQEHLVSEILRNLLGSMIRLYRPPNPVMKLVLATPAGEAHEFGLLASTMLAAVAGIETVYLGPNLPGREIAGAAERVGAQAILLGVTMITESTAREVSRVAAAIPERTELWVGGASSADIDLSNLGRRTVLVKDFPAFENECRRWCN